MLWIPGQSNDKDLQILGFKHRILLTQRGPRNAPQFKIHREKEISATIPDLAVALMQQRLGQKKKTDGKYLLDRSNIVDIFGVAWYVDERLMKTYTQYKNPVDLLEPRIKPTDGPWITTSNDEGIPLKTVRVRIVDCQIGVRSMIDVKV